MIPNVLLAGIVFKHKIHEKNAFKSRGKDKQFRNVDQQNTYPLIPYALPVLFPGRCRKNNL
jgi:hypothetical protein